MDIIDRLSGLKDNWRDAQESEIADIINEAIQEIVDLRESIEPQDVNGPIERTVMDPEKRKALEAAGFKVGTVDEFLDDLFSKKED